MERLKSIKDSLIGQIQGQLGHLETVSAKELGEVVDMVKDIEEAIYYCTITKSMEDANDEKQPITPVAYYTERYYPYERDMDREKGKMYYTPSGNSNTNSSGTAYYTEQEYPITMRDYREGRSPMSRRMYMESKEMHQDKNKQMKELEKYMKELTDDITEMIKDASPEEKQLLQKKIANLATRVQ